MKNFRTDIAATIVAAALLVFGLSSCSRAVVEGTFKAAPSSGVVVAKTIDGGGMKLLDTIKVEGGKFTYKMPMEKGQPEFVYLFCGETKVASLILACGDCVKVECDTLGSWTVSGSEDCELLRENELECAKLSAAGTIMAVDYIAYYRKMVRYVLEHSKSMTVVPVIFSKLCGQLPVFTNVTDGIIIGNIADSLETVYPDSRYVKLLRAEADARRKQLALQSMVDTASSRDYPELSFPDINGVKQSLSEAEGKATLVVFWDPSDATHKIFNQDALIPLWNEFSGKGLQIYQVALGIDKSTWALAVREQALPWVNVADTRGGSMSLFAVESVPCAYLISGGEMQRVPQYTAAAIGKAVREALK